MPSFCNNDGIVDEMTEAEACDTKKKKMNKKGKRKERKLPLACNKRIKLVDRLSGLPDDVIVSILSRLTLKEAARTSVISQRWINLWTWTTGTFDFDFSDKASRNYYPGKDRREPSSNVLPMVQILLYSRPWNQLVLYEKPPVVKKSRFVARVNRILSLHQGQSVEKFEISCTLLGRLKRSIISKWVEFALRKRVKSVILDLRSPYDYLRGNYSLHKAFLSKCNGLDTLTVLDLKKVDVTGKCISYILATCKFLEELSVEESSTLFDLRVPGPLPQLKCLKIKFCQLLRCIEIRAINIKSFAYHGGLIPVTFEKPPCLIEASYGYCYASSFITANMSQEFSSYASCLESLVLNMHGLYTFLNNRLPEFPVLENLKQFDLGLHPIRVDSIVNCVASLLEKCPILERLSLSASPFDADGGVEPRWPDMCLHKSLRVLELVECRSWDGRRAEMACFMVRSLPSLQQVIICVPEVSPINNRILRGKDREWSVKGAYEFLERLSKIVHERGEAKFAHVSCRI